ncbi:uncharacterized protein LOC135812002 isoform X1 [Sycon ciliatum]|uniref:uncharacterized protein LOC135812002 isoform X1 n=1 Tax=Sycon ciliatum TaxID=27933 RepID=UPI0031F63E29
MGSEQSFDETMRMYERYCLRHRPNRQTRELFTGLSTMVEFGTLRILLIGRAHAGKSATINKFLEVFGQPETQQEYDSGEGDKRVTDVLLEAADIAGEGGVFLRSPQGQSDDYRMNATKVRALFTNQLRDGDIYKREIRQTAENYTPDECHAVLHIIRADHVIITDMLDEELDELRCTQDVLRELGVVPVTIITRSGEEEYKDSDMELRRQVAARLIGSPLEYTFTIDNTKPEDDPIRLERLRLTLLLALRASVILAEQRLHRKELQRRRIARPQPSEDGKYVVAAFLKSIASRFGWPSTLLEDVEQRLAAVWLNRRKKNLVDGDFITPAEFVSILASRNKEVWDRIFPPLAADALEAQVKSQLHGFAEDCGLTNYAELALPTVADRELVTAYLEACPPREE